MPPRQDFDENTEAEIVRLYRDKWFRVAEIARLLDVGVLPINRVLRDHGVPVNAGDPQKTTRNQKIMDLRDEGYSFQEIANAFKITRQRAHQVVTRGY